MSSVVLGLVLFAACADPAGQPADGDDTASTDLDTDTETDADTDADSDTDTDSGTDTDTAEHPWAGTWTGATIMGVYEGIDPRLYEVCDVTLSVVLPEVFVDDDYGTATFTCAPPGMTVSTFSFDTDTLTETEWSGSFLVVLATGESAVGDFDAQIAGGVLTFPLRANGMASAGNYLWGGFTAQLTRE